jgi:nickel-type superoxide dismutase maturation protease
VRVRRRRTLHAVLTVAALAWLGSRRVLPVVVAGPSMLPTLRAGDALLVRLGAAVRPGDVVVARFPARPGLLVVKRAVHPDDDGWWVESDNPTVTDDSRRYGAALVVGRVVLRYWPPAQRRLLPPDPSGTRAQAPAG